MREEPSRSRYAIWRISAGRGVDWSVQLPPELRQMQLDISRTLHQLAGERTPVGYGYAIASWHDFETVLGVSQIEWSSPTSVLPDGEY